MIRATTSGIPEKVTSNGIDRGWRFVSVIEDGIPCGGNTMVVEGIAQRRNCERGTLCLGKVFLIISCQVSVHCVDIIDAGPGGVGVFWIAAIIWNVEVIHVAVRRGVDVSVEALEHGTFGFGLNDALNNQGDILFS